jgi:ferric-dicitrate binding protein FerR (iron transport regulator)
MDVSSAVSAAAAPMVTASEISMRVAKKALDATKAQGEAAISLLQSAVELQKQDRSYAIGPGGSLDVMA